MRMAQEGDFPVDPNTLEGMTAHSARGGRESRDSPAHLGSPGFLTAELVPRSQPHPEPLPPLYLSWGGP